MEMLATYQENLTWRETEDFIMDGTNRDPDPDLTGKGKLYQRPEA